MKRERKRKREISCDKRAKAFLDSIKTVYLFREN